jgi:hypothetical protein
MTAAPKLVDGGEDPSAAWAQVRGRGPRCRGGGGRGGGCVAVAAGLAVAGHGRRVAGWIRALRRAGGWLLGAVAPQEEALTPCRGCRRTAGPGVPDSPRASGLGSPLRAVLRLARPA